MKHRLTYLFASLLMIASLAGSLIHPEIAAASPKDDIASATFKFQNTGTIQGNFGSTGQISFVDQNTSDSIDNYAPTSGGFCNPTSGNNIPLRIGITLQDSPNFNASSIQGFLVLGYTTTVGAKSTCHDASRQITIQNPNGTASYTYEWDGNNISTFNGQQNGGTFGPAKNDANSNLYIDTSTGANACGGAIVLDSGSTSKGSVYFLSSSGIGDSISKYPVLAKAFPSNCTVIGPVAITISGTKGQAAADGGAGGVNNPSDDNSCESSGGGFSLNWLLCDAYQGVQSIVNWMFGSVIEPLLVTTPICLPNNGNCTDTIYQIWSKFRLYGDIFLVITLLVIVFGESIGGGMIEAYTAKKILPRLLAAAILINLSIYIMAFMIDMTNIVGGGIGALLTGPLNGNGLFVIHPGNITAGAIFVGTGGVALLAGFTAVSVTGIALLALGLAITGFIAVMGVFFTLIIRQAIIIGLVLVSPVAFALWCLPNTEQWFKRWWDTFFQMLLVYPMVVMLFAVADIMSYLTANNGNAGSFADSVVAFMLLLIPLFLIPFTLRSSNRLMGAIQGAASNVGRQINGATGRRALGAASQSMNEKLHNTGNYSGLSNRNRLFRGINTVTGTIANPSALLHGRAGVRSMRQGKQITHGAEALKDNAIFQANQGDDKFLLAVANRGLAEQKLAATQQKFQEARSRGDMEGMTSAQSTMNAQQHALDAATQLGATGRDTGVQHQALQALSRTGFQFEPGAAGYAELSDTARRMSGGDERAYSAIMNESQYNLRSAGRFDLGGINDGAGYNPGAGVSKASLYELANAKAESIQGMMDSLDTNATHPTQEHAVAYKELQAMLPNSKGAVRDEIVRQVDNLEQFGVKDFLQQPSGETKVVGIDPQTRKERRAPVTNDEVAQREARTYERPDPNRLGGDAPATPGPNPSA